MIGSVEKNNTGVWLFILFFSVFTFLGNAEPKNMPTVTVKTQNGNLMINAHKVRLGLLLEKISDTCHIDIRGLANRGNETITFASGNKPVEYELKRLLRHLNIDDYAFEYSGNRLIIVSVYPSPVTDNPEPPVSSRARPESKKSKSTAVRVVGTLEGSQAETLNLMAGDFVISYDGARISTAKQLVKLVNSKADSEIVDIIVLRDRRPLSLVVNGGRIGIRIRTVEVPSETLNPDNWVD